MKLGARGLAWAGVVAALLLLVGAFLLMPRRAAPSASSPEVKFIQDMIGHHTQAVTMSRLIRAKTQNRTIRSVALDIELSQTEQIRQMEAWLKLWQQPQGAPINADHAVMMGMASRPEMQRLNTLPAAQAEVLFLQLMIRHHQGALDMVEPMGRPQIRQEVRLLAGQMGTFQRGEIRTMQHLLARRGGQPLPFPPGMNMGTPETPMPDMEHEH